MIFSSIAVRLSALLNFASLLLCGRGLSAAQDYDYHEIPDIWSMRQMVTTQVDKDEIEWSKVNRDSVPEQPAQNGAKDEDDDDDDDDGVPAKPATKGPRLLNAAVLLNILLRNNYSEEYLKRIYASNAEIVALQTYEGDVLWIEARFSNDTWRRHPKPRQVFRRWHVFEKLEVFVPTAIAMLPLVGFWYGVVVGRA